MKIRKSDREPESYRGVKRLLCGALLVVAACGESGTALPTGPAVEEINKRLSLDMMAAPTITLLAECPPGGEQLDDAMRVISPLYPYAIGEDRQSAANLAIAKVTRYVAEEQVVAYCGQSVGWQADREIYGPPPGTVVIIPNRSDCQQPLVGEPLPFICRDMPLEVEASMFDITTPHDYRGRARNGQSVEA